eukprot:13291008-Heterocapsa_arctica.AAC.1
METATTGGTTIICSLSKIIDDPGRVIRWRVPYSCGDGGLLDSSFSFKLEAQSDRCRTRVTFDDSICSRTAITSTATV